MERLSFASLTLSAMTSHKRLKLRQCTNCECVINGVWEWVEECARGAAAEEPAMRGILDDVCLSRNSLATSISARLARKLSRRDMPRELIEPLIREALSEDQNILSQIAQDLIAIVDRDPACRTPLEPLLFYKGFHAITTYRISHWLWQHDRTIMALQFQSLASEVFAVDIHPAATIGCGILLDHATSFVVGETAIIRDNVSILHEVTLGGTGKDVGKRHPTIGDNVVIGAGAKVLGPFTVGSGSKIGALAVVLKAVPPNCTVVGNPGRIVRREGVAPQIDLDHVHLPDPIREHIVALERRVSELEEQMHNHYGTTVFKEDIQDDADL